MLKKIRSLTYQYAIPAAFIIFVLTDLLLLGLGQLLSFLPPTLPMLYLVEIIFILIPVALMFFFGFSSAFKKENILRGVFYLLPYVVFQLLVLGIFFSENLGNSDANWKPWYLVVYGVFSVIGIGIREECIFRGTIQNILAKKYAKSVKGIWITVIVAALSFGLTHITNVFFGMDPLAVLTQVISATCLGILFGAVYLRSGSIWALILIHTLTDIAGLAQSTFLYFDDIEDMNQLSWSWKKLIIYLIYIGFAAFLLRPSKHKQICESLCFADEEPETATRT